jgi:hypothetical protein
MDRENTVWNELFSAGAGEQKSAPVIIADSSPKPIFIRRKNGEAEHARAARVRRREISHIRIRERVGAKRQNN